MRAERKRVEPLLRTARGQLDGVLKMIEDDRYCMDIVTQLQAVESLVHKAQREVLRCGVLTLTNQDLAYYYWSEYYFLVNEGGSSLDPDTDPAGQPVDDSRTWQDTLLDRALLTVQDTSAMVLAAQEAGLLERVLEVGWAGLTAKESGRIGGLLAHKNRE